MRMILMCALFTHPAFALAAQPDPAMIGRTLVDQSVPEAQRMELIAQHPKLAAEILIAMGQETPVGTPQEYERIPWIWRVAVACGKKNDGPEIREILAATLPQSGEPLHDWQAVVIGGGIVNGIGLAGVNPRRRIEELLGSDHELLARYQRCIELSVVMADNTHIREGTRYDALRIIAMQPWEKCKDQLTKYLQKGTSEELQAGAISGALDVPESAAFEAVLGGVASYPANNRSLVLDGALRTPLGQKAVVIEVLNGTVTREMLGPERLNRLRQGVAEFATR